MRVLQVNYKMCTSPGRKPRNTGRVRGQTKYQPGLLFKDIKAVNDELPILYRHEVADLLKKELHDVLLHRFTLNKVGNVWYLLYEEVPVGYFTIEVRHVYGG